MEQNTWLHSPDETRQLMERILSGMEQSLSTPLAHWRSDPLCKKLLAPYEDGCAELSQLVWHTFFHAVRYTIYLWVTEPAALPKNGDLEDHALQLFQELIQPDLPVQLERWFTTMNTQISDLLRDHISQEMIAAHFRPMLFPGMIMGDWQLNLTTEIAYDLIIMLHNRLNSYGLSKILPSPKLPLWMQKNIRKRRYRHMEEELEVLLNEDHIPFRHDFETYLLCQEFVGSYRDCILENLRRFCRSECP